MFSKSMMTLAVGLYSPRLRQLCPYFCDFRLSSRLNSKIGSKTLSKCSITDIPNECCHTAARAPCVETDRTTIPPWKNTGLPSTKEDKLVRYYDQKEWKARHAGTVYLFQVVCYLGRPSGQILEHPECFRCRGQILYSLPRSGNPRRDGSDED